MSFLKKNICDGLRVTASVLFTSKWDKIYLIKPSEKPIVDDGTRYMAHSDYEIRKFFYEILRNLLDEFGYEYEELEGDYYSNFCTVKKYIEELYV